MSDQKENPESVDIAAEFSLLGKNIQQVLKTALESDEWKRIRGDVQQGVNDLGDTISKFMHDFSESETGQKVKTGLDDLQVQARRVEIEGRVREEVLNALHQANAGLEKAAAKMKEESMNQAQAGDGSSENTEEAASSPAEKS